MPANTSTTSLLSQISEAHEEVKGEATVVGGSQNLPPGIDNGIAKLSSCKFALYKTGDNQGKFYFMAMGVVITPDKTKDGIPVKGLFAKIGPLPICATKKKDGTVVSLKENLSVVYNELRKLGIETAKLEPTDLEETVVALQKVAPYFRFSTTESKATPQWPARTWQNWHGIGGLDDYDPDDIDENDNEEINSDTTVDTPKERVKVEVVEVEVVEVEVEEIGHDIDELLEACKAKGDPTSRGKAQDELKQLALNLGLDEEAVDDAPSWDVVVEWMNEKTEGDSTTNEIVFTTEEEEETTFVPGVKDVVYYKPKGKRKYWECSVTASFPKSEKCNLKDLNTQEEYKQVEWSKLKEEDPT
tara:strand:+ start:2216 stop:3289 length:1074 start_codon:yes stop_codon:yes gene_type:complete